jgi:hypothetical protein
MLDKYDKIIINTPISDSEINNLWIYEGNSETEYTPFAGKYFNKSVKAIYLNQNYLRKTMQIMKSIQGISENLFEEYDVLKKYKEGDVVKNDIFYISLINDNNKDLSDTDFWYPYNNTFINDRILLKDRSTREVFEIFMDNGELKYESIG